jgi:hypothetical protein
MVWLNVTYREVLIPEINIIGMPNFLKFGIYFLAFLGLVFIVKFIFEHIYTLGEKE